MYSNIKIANFRGLEDFELSGLGRVNLLVGQNNSGKSSILEAVHLLATGGNPNVLWDVAMQRGEYFSDIDVREIDPCHLFCGHRITARSYFSIVGEFPEASDSLDVRVIPADSQQALLFRNTPRTSATLNGDDLPIEYFDERLALEFTSSIAFYKPVLWELTRRGGLTPDVARRSPRSVAPIGKPVKFVSTSGQSVDEIVTLFEQFVLSPDERFALEALSVIEPSLERIATRSSDRRRASGPGAKGGIILKFKGQDLPVPIGSMGDGMWRLLGMALALAAARGGILLIDEIDTGLHYTTMDRMWQLLDTAARDLSVQVFATTHSRDCVDSLAVIASNSNTSDQEATIHRIERGKRRSVAFSGPEIAIAAERGIEVR